MNTRPPARRWPLFRFRSITTRLLFWTLGLIVLTNAVIIAISYVRVRNLEIDNLFIEVDLVRREVGSRVAGIFDGVEGKVAQLADTIELIEPDRGALTQLVLNLVAEDDELYGAAVAFEPYTFDPDQERAAVYYYQRGLPVRFVDLAGGEYRYWEQDWYRRTVAQRRPQWTEPYFDEGGGNVEMITYAHPLYREDGAKGRRLIGVVTADVALDGLQTLIAQIPTTHSGYGILFSASGRFITHPQDDYLLTNVREQARASGRPESIELVEQILGGQPGIGPITPRWSGVPSLVAYGPLPGTEFHFGYIFPREALFADLDRLLVVTVGIGLLELVILSVLIYMITWRSIRPLYRLSRATRRIGQGDLNTTLPAVSTHDEVGTLTNDFVTMRDALKEHIRQIKIATAMQQRLESELAIANEIQQAMLPAPRCAYRHRNRSATIAAMLKPSKTVGGDLYDYYLLDGRYLLVAVGDVSDKGVPAALFMARTSALLRVVAKQTREPSRILAWLNRELCESNDACMFVTMYCAVLDLDSGELACTSAGHEPALVSTADGAVRSLECETGPALGIDELAEYPASYHLRLAPGDGLLLYSDGVTEAFNAAGEAFTTQRLTEAVADEIDPGKPPEASDHLAWILRRIRAFTAGAAQSDDMTLLIVRYTE